MKALGLVVILCVSSLLSSNILLSCVGCHVQENWTPEARPAHQGCTAHAIYAGQISYVGGTIWRYHNAPYSKTPSSDRDCRQKTDCTYEDKSETAFSDQWSVEVMENGTWRSTSADISGDDTGANWHVSGENEEGEYRVLCTVNDTPDSSANGNDTAVTVHSDGHMVWAANLTGWDLDAGYPHYYVDPGIPSEPGNANLIALRWHWHASCCTEIAHLDRVTQRERVDYEGQWTWLTPSPDDPDDQGTHCQGHANSGLGGQEADFGNCWDRHPDDPTRNGVPGYQGYVTDQHSMPAYRQLGYYFASYCQGHQLYQWAKAKGRLPVKTDETAGWTTLDEYMIQRYAEQNDGLWRHRLTKGSWWCTYVLPGQ